MSRFFLDSNVLVYSAEPPGDKTSRAKLLLAERPVISVQVLNEFLRVATRKMKMPMEVAMLVLRPVKLAADIVPITLETHELATEIAVRHNLQIYDANIVAAAELSGCDVLYTEDLSHGQRFGRVLVQNPFVAA